MLHFSLPIAQKFHSARFLFALLWLSCLILSLNQHALAQVDVDVQAGHSGTYFNTERDGEGWIIEVLDATTALVIWFTYPAQGSANGEQAWIGGIGSIQGNRISVSTVNITSGATFGPEFDPDDVQRDPWGTFEMAFSGPDSGTIDYTGPAEFGSGSINFVRLAGIARLPFGVPSGQLPAPEPGQPGVSGSWVDPSHDGEGWFFLEIAPGVIIMAWFSYDQNGNQAWFVETGSLQNGVALFDNVRITSGARFGADFDSDDVLRELWGQVRVVFTSCSSAVLTYRSDRVEFGSGQLLPVRLTSLQNLACDLPEPPATAGASWRSTADIGPGLSELPAATIGDAIYVAGGYASGFNSIDELWRYRPDSDSWVQLQDLPAPRDHSAMVAYQGSLYLFGGYLTVGSQFSNSNTWRYDPATDVWTVLTPVPTGMAAGGAAVVGQFIYVVSGVNSDQVHRYNPLTDSWQSFELIDSAPRDHSAVVGYRGEFWILGGRNASGSASRAVTIFDPVTRESRPGPAMTSPRSGFAVAEVNGLIVVSGGENFVPPMLVGNTEVYNPVSQSWSNLASIPAAVHGASGVAFAGDFYVMQGSTLLGGINNISRNQVLQLSTSTQ